ncbi:DNA-binding protein [Brevibacillus panacihumi W25]|uniref:DNA-binding protein n=1 Tax=Brevibacillus panacihumi W25 TaxID=1408254 RepID=V6MEK8_9BACL|nr:DNA-binding protein [Brevibacillus panacihumi W25]
MGLAEYEISIKGEVINVTNELRSDDLPEVLEVKHIQQFLGIGQVQAYDLANSGQFHVVRVGRRIKIPKKSFLEWFYGKKQDA